MGSGSSVGILMSLYNGVPYLQQQLNSLLQQTCPDWTLYLRDDGSTDTSLTIMHQFAQQVGKERYVEVMPRNSEHLGVTASYATLLAVYKSVL
ncbi:hypothetical protein AD928_05275, partial [Acetobacter cerevisiae]